MRKRATPQAAHGDGERVTRPADFDKLPKRFKDYITGIENALARSEATAGSNTPTRVSVRSGYGRDESVRYLPDDTQVFFATAAKLTTDRHDVGVLKVELSRGDRLGRDRQRLAVSATTRVVVLPCVSNQIEVECETY